MVRKMIHMGRFSREAVKLIRQEGAIGQSLDSHHHIIKLVGTFWEAADDPDKCTLNILTFPVAVCDLEQALEGCKEFSRPEKISGYERAGLIGRLSKLDFNMSKAMPDIPNIKRRLQEIMGCLTEGIIWMHSQQCQHRDLKPANVILRPGRVLITDFGISRDRRLAAETTTEYAAGGTLGYMPPKVRNGEANNPAQTDVYSLGCVFLRILSVIHGPNQQLVMIAEEPHPLRDRFRERQFKEFIAVKGIDAEHQILPFLYQDLIANMMDDDRKKRPTATKVNHQLRWWSTADEQFHGPCCQKAMTPPAQTEETIQTSVGGQSSFTNGAAIRYTTSENMAGKKPASAIPVSPSFPRISAPPKTKSPPPQSLRADATSTRHD